jgi:hypothetical protein
MTTEDVSSIKIPLNYSGAHEGILFTNDDLLKSTSQERGVIYGPSLFALKYRILPCTATEKSQAFNRGQKWPGKRKQGGMYRATRLINY